MQTSQKEKQTMTQMLGEMVSHYVELNGRYPDEIRANPKVIEALAEENREAEWERKMKIVKDTAELFGAEKALSILDDKAEEERRRLELLGKLVPKAVKHSFMGIDLIPDEQEGFIRVC